MESVGIVRVENDRGLRNRHWTGRGREEKRKNGGEKLSTREEGTMNATSGKFTK